jgi:hypothetical protein
LDGLRDYSIFVGNFNYTLSEIEDHIKFLARAGVLRPTRSYNKQEVRYTAGVPLSDAGISIQEMLDELWDIHILEYDYLLQKGTLTDHEKENLKRLFGSVGSYKFFKERRSLKKKLPGSESELQLRMISSVISHKIAKFHLKYKNILKENYLYSDLVNKLIIRKSNQGLIILFALLLALLL